MNKLIIFIITIALFSSSCSNEKQPNLEQTAIKGLYSWASIYCTPFRLDTLNSLEQIGTYMDSLCLADLKANDVCIGFFYNLSDSTFAPSPDTSFNCIIPCGIGLPSHGRIAFGNDSFISGITHDSLTIHLSNRVETSRISISNLEPLFIGYMNTILRNESTWQIERVLITVDISNNPPKESFNRIFNILFWTYYSKCFTEIKSDPEINLQEVISRCQTDRRVIYDALSPILIYLVRDPNGKDYRFPVLFNEAHKKITHNRTD